MGFADIHGRARVSTTASSGFASCDYCGQLWNLVDLRPQMEWYGTSLTDTGFKACRICISKPQDQLRPIILPPDPIPLMQPRPEYYSTEIGLEGFTQYTLTPTDDPPQVKSDVLGQIAADSGIATPVVVTDRSGMIAGVNVAQQVMAANPARTWLLLYDPDAAQLGISKGTASFGAFSVIQPIGTLATTIVLGAGEALFWATAQGLGTVYQGAVSAVGMLAGRSFYAWEA